MKALRTPDERFADLPHWPYAPVYATVPDGEGGDLRIHFVDQGPPDAAPVLLLHGEPSWGYLYRKMIPPLVDAGHRVVVPDLVGFGRSDKPSEREDYTYARHVDWMAAWLEALDLQGITLFCQDWGGLIGLRLVARFPERFARVVAANTFLPLGDTPPPEAFLRWREYSQTVPRFHAGGIVSGGCVSDLPPEVVAAYDAPFPDDAYLAGARIFPMLVPFEPDNPAIEANHHAWEVLRRWEKPFLCAFSDRPGPASRGADGPFRAQIPGAQGQPHTTIVGAGHFLQEDQGEAVAAVLLEFIASTDS